MADQFMELLGYLVIPFLNPTIPTKSRLPVTILFKAHNILINRPYYLLLKFR